MFRTVQQVEDSLVSGKTSLKSVQNSISKYRRRGDLDITLMFIEAKERYLHKLWLEEQAEKDL
jgi:hypothetical protein